MEIIICLISITYAIILLFIAFIFKQYTNVKNKEVEIREKELLADLQIDLEEINILDKVINDSFIDYRKLHLDYREDLYITPEIQGEMIHDLLSEIMNKISDNLINKLSLYYKKEHLEDLICRKIQMLVLDYSAAINGNYSDKK